MKHIVNYNIIMFLTYVLFGCSSNSSVSNNYGNTSSTQLMTNPTASKAVSGWEDSIALLIPLPIDLDDDLDYVVDVLYNQEKYTHYIAANGTLDQRRALAFYTCAVDNNILMDEICLRTSPAIEGYYDTQISALASSFGATVVDSVFVSHNLTTYYYLEWNTTLTRQYLWNYCDSCLSNNSYIQYAGTVSLGEPAEAPDDAEVLYEPGQCYSLMSASAPIAWENTRGTYTNGLPVYVAILDTGLAYNHPEFTGRYINAGYDLNNAYQVRYDTESIPAMYDLSDQGTGTAYYHGTGVAGVLCANDNSTGVVGVAPECKIVPFNISENNKFPTQYFLDACETVTNINADESIEIVAVNFSGLFKSEDDRPEIYDAVEMLATVGITIVCTDTGNEQVTTPRVVPGGYNTDAEVGDYVIAVSWLEFDNTWFSDQQYWFTSGNSFSYTDYSDTDIFAPSRSIQTCSSTNYDDKNGVSFGIPAVTAALALITGKNDSSANLKSQLLDMARPIRNFNVVDGVGGYKALDVAALNPIESCYTGFSALYPNLCESVVTGNDHLQFYVPDENLSTATIENEGQVYTFQKYPTVPVTYGWTGTDLFSDFKLSETQSVTLLHLQQLSSSDVSGLWFLYDTSDPCIHYYYERVYSGSTNTWSDPEFIFSITNTSITDVNKVLDHVRYSSSAGIYVLDTGTYNEVHRYGGIADPSSTLQYISGNVELCKGYGHVDTLVFRDDTNVLYKYNPTSGVTQAALYGAVSQRLFDLGEIGSYPGFAWLDNSTERLNIYTVDPTSGDLAWVFTGYYWYGNSNLRWSVEGDVIDMMVTGNTNNLPYLVIGVQEPTYGMFMGYEGIRANWPNSIKTDSPSEPDAYVIKETIDQPEYSIPYTPSLSSAFIDQQDRLNLFFKLESSYYFQAKTLDYD